MKRGFVIALAVLAGACTSTKTSMLDTRTAIISGHGSAFHDMADVTKNVVVKAATEAQARGFQYFVILDARDASKTSYWQAPTQTDYNATAMCSGGACFGSGTAQTYGGQVHHFNKPGANVTVRFFYEGEVDPSMDGVWSAAGVLAAQEK